jgi:glutathione synthase
MKIAFQMEGLEYSDPEATNSLILIAEANSRGHSVFHYLPESLSIDNAAVYAEAASVSVDLSQKEYYRLGDYSKVDLTKFDVVFMRQHPPFDINYITATFILDKLTEQGVFVTNNPFWIRNTPEKLSIYDFKEYMPPTLVSQNLKFIKEFLEQHKDIIIKPLHDYFGNGIVRTSSMDEVKKQMEHYKQPLMFQSFLQEIKDGNKRIVLFDGEIIGGRRTIPKSGEFNTHQNGRDSSYNPNEYEIALCRTVGKVLKNRGIDFAGLDIIGKFLVEINVTCVGSLMDINKLDETRYEKLLWDIIEKKVGSIRN